MSLKPIKLYSHANGPNPWKVAIVLQELGVPYTMEFVDFSSIKQKPYIDINPNGRVPSIEDPNSGIKLWESGAIITYLIETYDKDHKISYPLSPEKYYQQQWLHFQMSGQGPYYGQFAWFSHFHQEKLPSAIDRYHNEVKRVISVIELHLSSTGHQYLVGDKCTFADLAFVPWANIMSGAVPEAEEKYPAYYQWLQTLLSRSAVSKVWAERAEALKQQAH